MNLHRKNQNSLSECHNRMVWWINDPRKIFIALLMILTLMNKWFGIIEIQLFQTKHRRISKRRLSIEQWKYDRSNKEVTRHFATLLSYREGRRREGSPPAQKLATLILSCEFRSNRADRSKKLLRFYIDTCDSEPEHYCGGFL